MHKPELKWTRAQYMARECTHADYYAQFVTPEVTRMLEQSMIGSSIKRTPEHHATHFNNIELHYWDHLAAQLPGAVLALVMDANESTHAGVRAISLSDKVCVLKAAARQIWGDR